MHIFKQKTPQIRDVLIGEITKLLRKKQIVKAPSHKEVGYFL